METKNNKTMRKHVLKMSVSVDGFVGGPNGEIDWILKSLDEAVTAWLTETVWQAGVHIMGSRTFHDMASYWPFSADPIAAPMNQIPKVVFSKKGFIASSSEGLTTTALRDASRLKKLEHPQSPSSPTSPAMATWDDAAVAGGDLKEEITERISWRMAAPASPKASSGPA
jgi:hypothetical protein